MITNAFASLSAQRGRESLRCLFVVRIQWNGLRHILNVAPGMGKGSENGMNE